MSIALTKDKTLSRRLMSAFIFQTPLRLSKTPSVVRSRATADVFGVVSDLNDDAGGSRSLRVGIEAGTCLPIGTV